jgi:hypothetical protein
VALRHPGVIWFLLTIMPFQGLVVAYLEHRGPAHFHVDHDFFEHADDGHTHDHPERHHHRAGDQTVVAVEDVLDSIALEEETVQGGATMTLVALVSPDGSLHRSRRPDGLLPADTPLPKSRFLGRLERPPRISLA